MVMILRDLEVGVRCDTCQTQTPPERAVVWTDEHGHHVAYDVSDAWIVVGQLEYCSEACFLGRAKGAERT